MAGRPALQQWYTKVKARPSFEDADVWEKFDVLSMIQAVGSRFRGQLLLTGIVLALYWHCCHGGACVDELATRDTQPITHEMALPIAFPRASGLCVTVRIAAGGLNDLWLACQALHRCQQLRLAEGFHQQHVTGDLDGRE